MSTSATLVGRLTRDPELRTLPSGTTVASMRIAVDRAGDRQDDGGYGPGFFDASVFGTQAENVERYMHKGDRVAVFGRLSFHEWEKDGDKRSKVEVIADRVDFLTTKAESEAGGGGSGSFPEPQGADDDIPF